MTGSCNGDRSEKKLYIPVIVTVIALAVLTTVFLYMRSRLGFAGVSGTLQGRVLDENKKPIRGARVFTYLPDSQTVQDHTDWRGHYKLTDLPDDRPLRVMVFYTGYGHNRFDGLTTGGNFDLRIYPQGYELFGKQAPSLQVDKWFNSQPQSLSELRGKVVLLHIGIHIDTYDDYNRRVLQMYDKYASRGLAVMAVHINHPTGSWPRRTTEEEITAYLEERNIDFPVGLDKAEIGTHGATYKAYGAKASPAKFLIDKKGILRCSPIDENLEKWIQRLLAE